MISDKEMNHRLIELTTSPRMRVWRVSYDDLSSPERVFGVVWELEADVNNGGFKGYFSNHSACLAPCAADALRTIGAVFAAAIVERALEAAGNLAWSNIDLRRAQIQGLTQAATERLEALTQEFFTYPDNLTALLYRYVCQHRAELGAPDDF
jgi:hypothetical protein